MSHGSFAWSKDHLLSTININQRWGSWIKVTIGVGKGRKLHDKRAAEKEKQSKKDVKAAMARF